MKTRIISNAEIKALTQSGASDSLIAQWNLTATEILCDVLGVSDLGVHTVTDERIKNQVRSYLEMKEFPVDVDQAITLKSPWDFTTISSPPASYFLDPRYIRHVRGKDGSGNAYTFPKGCEVLATYIAGYTVVDSITLTANALEDQTLETIVEGVAVIYTFKATITDADTQIKIEGTIEETLNKIAEKVPGTVVSPLLTGDLGSRMISTTIVGATITNATIPDELRTAVAFIAVGGIAQNEKVGGIQSYTIGQKTISFSDSGQASFVQQTVQKYASFKKKVQIF